MTQPKPGGPMPTHQPTPEQLERLEVARHNAFLTETAVAAAFAKLSQALAEHSEASLVLTRAIGSVLYGPQDGPDEGRATSAYEHSNDLARQHWPTRPPAAPGG